MDSFEPLVQANGTQAENRPVCLQVADAGKLGEELNTVHTAHTVMKQSFPFKDPVMK